MYRAVTVHSEPGLDNNSHLIQESWKFQVTHICYILGAFKLGKAKKKKSLYVPYVKHIWLIWVVIQSKIRRVVNGTGLTAYQRVFDNFYMPEGLSKACGKQVPKSIW